MKAETTIQSSHMCFETFDTKLSTYETILKKLGSQIHHLSPSHPLKLFLVKIMREIKDLPEETLYQYFELRSKKNKI
jgi:hypothetical protein